MIELHAYSHSSASYRVRIALALKGIGVTHHSVCLRANDHQSTVYLDLNPQGRVPALVTEEGVLTQSLAIVDWLEEFYPRPSLYPQDPWQRSLCRAFAHVIASDIFPLQNLNVRRKLADDFGADEARVTQWCADWIAQGFGALEKETANRGWSPGQGYLYGQEPTLADICLVPQMNNARRFGVDLTMFPLLVRADAQARVHPAFLSTAPETQIDSQNLNPG
ncbi:maleylacetoacetate isomerase [Candidatus Phycosocius spiralis]|uniref:Maleylacetoacetate isomerase n=1 Tax=Candidatus Phycosocius spiralis TaxID=2815099 RepID=A0ABQ4PXD4_9PROT|nr:maleylacetoacetate isomerase [Candidatus Phycosocius spiralis]GIU67687.1 maleylacetoacetate isomerase [Candidatus Phycosocius spiralis]